jgi:FAD/FMN-containing dehydrogenase
MGLLRVAPPDAAEAAVREHAGLMDRAIARGGTIYPYGSFPLGPDSWPRILRDGWSEYAALKRRFDPAGILNPSFGLGAAVQRAAGR